MKILIPDLPISAAHLGQSPHFSEPEGISPHIHTLYIIPSLVQGFLQKERTQVVVPGWPCPWLDV